MKKVDNLSTLSLLVTESQVCGKCDRVTSLFHLHGRMNSLALVSKSFEEILTDSSIKQLSDLRKAFVDNCHNEIALLTNLQNARGVAAGLMLHFAAFWWKRGHEMNLPINRRLLDSRLLAAFLVKELHNKSISSNAAVSSPRTSESPLYRTCTRRAIIISNIVSRLLIIQTN